MSEPVVKANTSAGRLFNIISAARALPANTTALDGWRKVFGLPRTAQGDLMRYLAFTVEQVNDTEAGVRYVLDKDDRDIVFAHFDEVKAVANRLISMSGNTMEWCLAGLTDAGMLSLRLAATRLGRRSRESTLSDSDVEALVAQVTALMRAVSEADVDSATAGFIRDLLLQARRALREYKFQGTAVVERAANELVGAAVRNPEKLSRIADSNLGTRFGEFIGHLDSVLSIAAATVALALAPGQAQAAVTPPPPSPVVVQVIERCGAQPQLPAAQVAPQAPLEPVAK